MLLSSAMTYFAKPAMAQSGSAKNYEFKRCAS
jgi:hypothetical protein